MASPAFAAPRRLEAALQRLVREHGWGIVAVLPALLFWMAELTRYHFFPDPLYGGDSWAQLGIATHIYEGHAPWEDPQLRGEWAFRDWLLFVVVAGLARAFATEPLAIALVLPAFWIAAGGFVAYAIGRRLFPGRSPAAFLALGWTLLSPFPAFQSSSFAAMLLVPLFVLALVSQDGSLRRRVLLGLAWAAASLSYLVAFFGTTLVLAAVFFWRARSGRDALVRETRAALPVALVGLPAILLLWGPLFWIYHGHVLNPSHLYAAGGTGWSGREAGAFLLSYFVGGSDRPWLVPLALLGSLGVYAAWKDRGTRAGRVALLLLGVGLAGTFSYVLTQPLFGTNLVHFRWPKIFLAFAQVLLATHAFVFLARKRRAVTALALAAVVLLGAVASPAARAPEQDRALAASDDARGLAMLDAARFVRENVPKDAVFLAHDQEAHAWNGLTGAHVVAPRRTHANVFVDMDQRVADLAIMLYGTDRAFAQRLMDEYGVTHAYAGPAFEHAQRTLPIATHAGFADYWRAHGVPFREGLAPRDPYGDAPRFESVIVREDAPALFVGEFTAIHRVGDDEGIWLVVARRG